MERLTLSADVESLVISYNSAKAGGGYSRKINRSLDSTLTSLIGGLLVGCLALGFMALAYEHVYSSPSYATGLDSVLLGAIFLSLVGFAVLMLNEAFTGMRLFLKLMFSKEQKRLPEEEKLLKDELALVAVELSRQIDAHNALLDELEIAKEMDDVNLPINIDISTAESLAHALREDITAKMRQLEVLIRLRKQGRTGGRDIDITLMQSALGESHRALIARVKTDLEMGDDFAVSALSSALRNEALHAELGDVYAIARRLADKRGAKT